MSPAPTIQHVSQQVDSDATHITQQQQTRSKGKEEREKHRHTSRGVGWMDGTGTGGMLRIEPVDPGARARVYPERGIDSFHSTNASFCMLPLAIGLDHRTVPPSSMMTRLVCLIGVLLLAVAAIPANAQSGTNNKRNNNKHNSREDTRYRMGRCRLCVSASKVRHIRV